jgi:hypothetical protein
MKRACLKNYEGTFFSESPFYVLRMPVMLLYIERNPGEGANLLFRERRHVPLMRGYFYSGNALFIKSDISYLFYCKIFGNQLKRLLS